MSKVKKSASVSSRPESNSKNSNLFLIGILLLTVIVFSGVVTDFFLNIDDDVYFTKNPFIKSLSFDNLKLIFTKPYGGNYHPLTTILSAIEYSWFGMKAKPFHAVSLFVHLLNTVLVYLFAGKFSRRTNFRIIVTALFAIHPMHLESVAWIADQTDLFYATFFISGMIFYINYIKSNRIFDLLLVYVFFVFSLLCKPAAIAFPGILFLLDYYFTGKIISKPLQKLPFILIAGAFAYVTYFTLHVSNTISKELLPNYSLIDRFFIANYTFSYYIINLFAPFNLAGLHLALKKLPWIYYAAPAFTLAVVFVVLKAKTFRKELFFALGFYLLTIGLVLQLIPTGYNIVAERYTYIPYLGFFLLLAWLYEAAANGKFENSFFRSYYQFIAVGTIIFFYVITAMATADWKSLLEFNRNIAKKNEKSSYAQLSAAIQEQIAGNTEAAEQGLQNASELDPTNAEISSLKGQMYFQSGNYQKAVDCFLNAKTLKDSLAGIDNFLASTYFSLQKYDSSVFYFDKVLKKDSSINVLQDKATSLFMLNRFDEAASLYTFTLGMDSLSGRAFSERGACYQKLGKIDLACQDWNKALELGREECRADIQNNCH